MTDDYDSPWKDVLDAYFADFLALFLPHAHADIDWSRGWESLDTELHQITPDADTGKRLADKLIKVWRADGVEQWVYIHVEVQSQKDRELPARMATYHYRLLDRYNAPIVSIAVLGDDNRRWRPDEHRFALWGCERHLRYPVIKLLDYEAGRATLEASANPFAIMVLAHIWTPVRPAMIHRRADSAKWHWSSGSIIKASSAAIFSRCFASSTGC